VWEEGGARGKRPDLTEELPRFEVVDAEVSVEAWKEVHHSGNCNLAVCTVSCLWHMGVVPTFWYLFVGT